MFSLGKEASGLLITDISYYMSKYIEWGCKVIISGCKLGKRKQKKCTFCLSIFRLPLILGSIYKEIIIKWDLSASGVAGCIF